MKSIVPNVKLIKDPIMNVRFCTNVLPLLRYAAAALILERRTGDDLCMFLARAEPNEEVSRVRDIFMKKEFPHLFGFPNKQNS